MKLSKLISRGGFAYLLAPFLTLGGAHAAQNSISFDTLAVGTVVSDQYHDVKISLLGNAPIAGPRIYALNDTQGNPVNVFGASGMAITPGDNVGGINPPFFDVQFLFKSEISYFSIQVLDADENFDVVGYSGSQQVQLAQRTLLGVYRGPVFNGPTYQATLGQLNGPALFDRVVISLNGNSGPELYDNLVFQSPVPEPNSRHLLVLGAVMLLVRSRARSAGGISLNSIRLATERFRDLPPGARLTKHNMRTRSESEA